MSGMTRDKRVATCTIIIHIMTNEKYVKAKSRIKRFSIIVNKFNISFFDPESDGSLAPELIRILV